MWRYFSVILLQVLVVASCSNHPIEPNIHTDYPYLLQSGMEGQYVEVEGYLVSDDGGLYFEPLGSREAAADFLVALNFDDEVMNCLREMEHPRGMIWSTYRSGEFVEFVSFGSYLNLDRDGSEPPIGCWASSG